VAVALQQAVAFELSEAVGEGLASCADGVEMIEPFVQAEVAQVVGAKLHAQEAGELLVLFDESALPVGAEDVMAMLDLIDGSAKLSASSTAKKALLFLWKPIRFRFSSCSGKV
jgi:hypothetical protein